jgi:glycosyltransferase involved in cell wall biosynthesis
MMTTMIEARATPLPHIAILASPERIADEGSATSRLAVALVAEGATVTLLDPLPERDPDATQPERVRLDRRFELPRRVRYEARVPFWRRRDRVQRLAAAFERSAPDIIWSAGSDGWALATALGEELDRPVALEVRRRDDCDGAVRALRSDRVVALITPTPALTREAQRLIGEQFVREVPMGVRLEESVLPRVGPPQVIAILAEGRDERAFTASLVAARAALERSPELLFTVEFPRNASAALWRFARSLGLLDRITAIDARGGSALSMTAVRACDVLLLPEPRGGPRAETLVALARGVPIIAATDPMADLLIDGETAILLPSGDQHARQWADVLVALLAHPEQARGFAERGRSLVLARHRSAHVASLCLATVQDLLREGPVRFVTNGTNPAAAL